MLFTYQNESEGNLAKTIFSAYVVKMTPRYREIIENGKRKMRPIYAALHNVVYIKVWHNLQKNQFWLNILEIL